MVVVRVVVVVVVVLLIAVGLPGQEGRFLAGHVSDGVGAGAPRQPLLLSLLPPGDVRQAGASAQGAAAADTDGDAVDQDDDGATDRLHHLRHLVPGNRLPEDDGVGPGGEGGHRPVGRVQGGHHFGLRGRGEAAGEGLDGEDGLEDDGGAAGQHVVGLLGNHILEVLQSELDLERRELVNVSPVRASPP